MYPVLLTARGVAAVQLYRFHGPFMVFTAQRRAHTATRHTPLHSALRLYSASISSIVITKRCTIVVKTERYCTLTGTRCPAMQPC